MPSLSYPIFEAKKKKKKSPQTDAQQIWTRQDEEINHF